MAMIITSREMRVRLREACADAGSVKGWAMRNGLHWAHVYNVLLGKKEPGERVLAPLGLGKIAVYTDKPGREVL